MIYPPKYDPRISPIYAERNRGEGAGGGGVWRLRIDAENWLRTFPPENQVKILSGVRELTLGTRWTRATIGFDAPRRHGVRAGPRLSWSTAVDGEETGSTAFHGWIITLHAEGCHVVSEETQQGPWFLEQLGHRHPGGLASYHQDWVEALAHAAKSA